MANNGFFKSDKSSRITRVITAQDLGGMPPPPPPGGDPMGGMMGGGMGAPPPPPAPGGAVPGDIAGGGTVPEQAGPAKDEDLERDVPEDTKQAIKQKVKSKVEEKIQEVTGQPAAEIGEEEMPAEGEMPPPPEVGAEGEIPEAPAEITEESPIDSFPSAIDQMDEDQLAELFEKAKEIVLGEAGKEGSKPSEKSYKEKSPEEKLSEGEKIEAPPDLTSTATNTKPIKIAAINKIRAFDPSKLRLANDADGKRIVVASMQKQADIVVGHMERDGKYYVSCPNTNIKAAIGISRVHPVMQCKQCPYYGDNGDNVGSNQSQIFCSYADHNQNAIPVRYIPITTSDFLREKEGDTTLPFGNLIKEPSQDESIWSGNIKLSEEKTAKKVKVAVKNTTWGEKVKQDQVVEKKEAMGEIDIDGENYIIKRNGNDIDVYKDKKLIDTIKGAINYNATFVRDNEVIARLLKSPAIQTKLDNRRAYYKPLMQFRKYASEVSERQALKSVVEGNSWNEDQVDDFLSIVNDNGYSIILTSQDKKWIRRAARATDKTKKDGEIKMVNGIKNSWEDGFFKGK